jgi:hypothetical protein
MTGNVNDERNAMMKYEKHGIEMEHAGEDPFGDDIWFCEQCSADEEYYEWHNDAYQQDHPEEYTNDDDLEVIDLDHEYRRLRGDYMDYGFGDENL